MKNLLAMAALGLVVFAGLGWYLDWYRIASTSSSGHRQINIDLNTEKIKQDVKEKVQHWGSNTQPNASVPPNTNPQFPVPQYPTGTNQPPQGVPFNVRTNPGGGLDISVNPGQFLPTPK